MWLAVRGEAKAVSAINIQMYVNICVSFLDLIQGDLCARNAVYQLASSQRRTAQRIAGNNMFSLDSDLASCSERVLLHNRCPPLLQLVPERWASGMLIVVSMT